MKQRLAAILAADAAGYSRLMAADERATVGGAVDAALVIQAELAEAAQSQAEQRQMLFRIGVHLGDVMEKSDGSVYGDGVNIAARLQALGRPGAITVSETVWATQRNRAGLAFDDEGEHIVKNIAHAVRAYRVRPRSEGEVEVEGQAEAERDVAVRSQLALPDKPSIAVLPFDNMSKDPEQEYFADGVVEAITATLSRIRSFFVIARNSAFLYKGKAIDVQRVGRELGVRYLLEGSVQRAGNRLRITVQLIDAANGAHVWANRFDGSVEDLFDLQDRITEQVAGALQPSIRFAEVERARRKRPQDLGAYDYTMRAMPHVWALDRQAADRALELLAQALAIEPAYPLALSLAGWCHAQRSVYNWVEAPEAEREQALRCAEKAADEGGADDPLVLAVLGAVHTFLRNFGTARLILERALAIDANLAWAWSRLGWVENYSDRPERAIECFQRALRLSPLDPMNFNNDVGLASTYEIMERYQEAVAHYRRALQARPNALWILRNLVSSLVGAGRMDEARMEYARLIQEYPSLNVARFRNAMVFSPAVMDRMVAHLKQVDLPD